MTEQLEIWVIYDHPRDHPGWYVARRWIGTEPQSEMFVSKDVGPLQAWMEAHGLYRLEREAGDDPTIMETWI